MAFDPAEKPIKKVGSDLSPIEHHEPHYVDPIAISYDTDQLIHRRYGSTATSKALKMLTTGRTAERCSGQHQKRWSRSAFGDRLVLASGSSVAIIAVSSNWLYGSPAGFLALIVILAALLMMVFTVAPVPMKWYPHLFDRGVRREMKPDPDIVAEIRRLRREGAVHTQPELVQAIRVVAATDYLSASEAWNSDMLAAQSIQVNQHEICNDALTALSQAVSIRIRAERERSRTGDDREYQDRISRIERSVKTVTDRIDVLERVASEVYQIDSYNRNIESLMDAQRLDWDIIDAEVNSELRGDLSSKELERVFEIAHTKQALEEMVDMVSKQTRML